MPSLIFTAKALKDLVCPAGTAKIDFHDKGCKGLMLEARMSGKRTWYLRYRDARGTQRQFRLADAQDLPLELARKRADELRGQIALGHDPAAQKAVLRCATTSFRVSAPAIWTKSAKTTSLPCTTADGLKARHPAQLTVCLFCCAICSIWRYAGRYRA